MADLNDLGYDSILDQTHDEAIERLRQIRLARRTPEKTTRVITKSSTKKSYQTTPNLSADQAANLLKLLEEN